MKIHKCINTSLINAIKYIYIYLTKHSDLSKLHLLFLNLSEVIVLHQPCPFTKNGIFEWGYSVVVSTSAFHVVDLGSIPGSGSVGIFCVLLNRVALSFGWDVKPRSSLCTHAFKNMYGLKRTWMTKQKSRGPANTQITCTWGTLHCGC